MSEEAAQISEKRMIAWAKRSAAYRLSRRMMSAKELADAIGRKARSKFGDIDDARVKVLQDAAVEYGILLGALDDSMYAYSRTRSLSRNGRSGKAIRTVLRNKGIAEEEIGEHVAGLDDLRAAIIFARKRRFACFSSHAGDPDRTRKEMQSVLRQGFGFGTVKRLFGLARKEAEDYLHDHPDTLG